jgi:hypothetical protein
MNLINKRITNIFAKLLTIFLGLFLIFPVTAIQAQENQREMIKKLQEMAPYRGYLQAHRDAQPQELLGGPIEVSIEQASGGVFVILPSPRKLDPHVFGTPEMPRAIAGTPGINGLPPMARKTEDGKYTETKSPNPFGDKNIVMADATLKIDATDATAADASETNDKVQMMASWKDSEGNTYEVRCCEMMAASGIEFPTFGGVLTNHILHGSSRIGTALMPTEYTYFAFWGMGEVLKNGEVTDKPRLIHGMLTPGRKHFHLMIPPMMPDQETKTFQHKDVSTGFTLPNGMELPFWHVMFENLEIESS